MKVDKLVTHHHRRRLRLRRKIAGGGRKHVRAMTMTRHGQVCLGSPPRRSNQLRGSRGRGPFPIKAVGAKLFVFGNTTPPVGSSRFDDLLDPNFGFHCPFFFASEIPFQHARFLQHISLRTGFYSPRTTLDGRLFLGCNFRCAAMFNEMHCFIARSTLERHYFELKFIARIWSNGSAGCSWRSMPKDVFL